MEFKNREEATFWQLALLAEIRSGLTKPAVMQQLRADNHVEEFRARAEELTRKEEEATADLKAMIGDLKKMAKGGPGDPMDILSLVKPPEGGDDPIN